VIKLRRGNPGKRRLRPEPEPARGETCPDAPRYLRGVAADEWHTVAPELWRIGLLRVTDIHVLGAYCMAVSRWATAETSLAQIAEKDPLTHGLLIKAADGTPRRNPLVKIASDAADAMLSFASQLGATPAARARLAAGPFGQPQGGGGKFDGLLG
jgi:P27 family predicted phage terminase small subunit